MPNAPTHDFITLVSVAAADVAYFHYAPQPQPMLAVLFTGAYVFAGYACAGDLDLKSTEYNRWGPLKFLWLPYQWLVPHRSWVSHGLLLGGIIRALYLGVLSALVLLSGYWIYGRLFPLAIPVDPFDETRNHLMNFFAFTKDHPRESIALFSGFILAGTAHSIADTISTWFRRRF